MEKKREKRTTAETILLSKEAFLAYFVAAFLVVLLLTTNLGQDMYSFLKDLTYLIVGGLALMIVIMLGEIDISAGTVLGVIGFFAGNMIKKDIPLPLVILVAIAVGMINSLIIILIKVRFGVPTMVTSLALIKLHIGLFPLLPNAGWVSNMPSKSIAMGNAKIGGVFPVMLVFALLILVFFIWLLKYTRFGRNIYAVGGKSEVAKLAGINADRVKIKTFMLSGMLLGITCIMYWLPASQIQPSGTIGLEMYFIPVAVVSGASILGGTGKPIGILFSAVLIGMLQRACILWGLGNAWLYLTYGVIVLIAVYSSVSTVHIKHKKVKDKREVRE